jgi:hypothetical protein
MALVAMITFPQVVIVAHIPTVVLPRRNNSKEYSCLPRRFGRLQFSITSLPTSYAHNQPEPNLCVRTVLVNDLRRLDCTLSKSVEGDINFLEKKVYIHVLPQLSPKRDPVVSEHPWKNKDIRRSCPKWVCCPAMNIDRFHAPCLSFYYALRKRD